MEYIAKHRFADVAPRKMRPIAQLIRGKNIDEALEALRFLPNRGARLIESVVKSAIGNAGDQGCRAVEDLVVTDVRIDCGPMFKRIRPRARGTAFGIKKRLAHILVGLTDLEDLDKTPAETPDAAAIPAPAALPAAGPALPVAPAPAETAPTPETTNS